MISSNPGKIGRSGVQWLHELYDASQEHPELVSEWNQGFLSSILERVNYYGEDTWFSEKQIYRLKEIAHSLGMI